MAESRLRSFLKAARLRKGWSRETLAYKAGVSFAAIAQIESGRRKDVRLSSLVALADALDVSVDYLLGRMPAMTPLLRHRALLYETTEGFTDAVLPFFRQGAERGERLLAVTNAQNLAALGDELGGEGSPEVRLVDSADWYTSPEETSWRYRAAVEAAVNDGIPWIRMVGEPVWGGQTRSDLVAWSAFESLTNVTLTSSPCTLVCAYDTTTLPKKIADIARRTHPRLGVDEDAEPNVLYESLGAG